MITINANDKVSLNLIQKIRQTVEPHDKYITFELHCVDKHIVIDEFIIDKGMRNLGQGTRLLKELRHLCNLFGVNLIIYPISGHNKLFNRNKKWMRNCNLIMNTDSEGFTFYSNNKLTSWQH